MIHLVDIDGVLTTDPTLQEKSNYRQDVIDYFNHCYEQGDTIIVVSCRGEENRKRTISELKPRLKYHKLILSPQHFQDERNVRWKQNILLFFKRTIQEKIMIHDDRDDILSFAETLGFETKKYGGD